MTTNRLVGGLAVSLGKTQEKYDFFLQYETHVSQCDVGMPRITLCEEHPEHVTPWLYTSPGLLIDST